MISSVGSSYSAAMMSAQRPRMEPDSSKITEDLLAAADTDEDGAISETEFTSLLESNSDADSETISNLFAEMDSDGDGSATSAEIDAAVSSLIQQMQQQGAEGNRPPPPPGAQPPPPPPNAEEVISNGDTDGDGSLNLEEFTEALAGNDSSRLAEMFAEADTDSDGQVSEEELQTAMDNHAPGGPGGPQASASNTAVDFLSAADTDGDSSLSLEEFTETLGGNSSSSSIVDMFEQADTDGDEQVSQEELQTAMESNPPGGANQAESSDDERVSRLVNSLVDKYQSSDSSSSLSATA